MQIAKGAQKSARGQPNPRISLQCDISCRCQRQRIMSRPKRQHFHQFLVEKIGKNLQSSRLRCIIGISIWTLIGTASTIESLSDILKQFPTLPFRRFNIIVRQRQRQAQASNPRIRRPMYFSHRPPVLPSPLKRVFAWPERPLAQGRDDTTGKPRF